MSYIKKIRKIVYNFLKQNRKYIKSYMRFARRNATGKSSKSLKIATSSRGRIVKGSLFGNETIYYVLHGRRDGDVPNLSVFVNWIRAKGIKTKNENQLAFLIRRKIQKEGTRLHKSGKFITDAINSKKRFDDLTKDVNKSVTEEINQDVAIRISKMKKSIKIL